MLSQRLNDDEPALSWRHSRRVAQMVVADTS